MAQSVVANNFCCGRFFLVFPGVAGVTLICVKRTCRGVFRG